MAENIKNKENITTPLGTISTINSVLIVLFRIDKPAKYSEINTMADMTPMVASKALSAARDMTLAEYAGKRGLYVLTAKGKEYARLVSANKLDEAKKILFDILMTAPAYEYIITFLRGTYGKPVDPLDLVLSIETRLGKSYTNSNRNSISKCLGSILVFANLIKYEDGKMVSLLSLDKEVIKKDEEEDELIDGDENQSSDKKHLLKTNDFTFIVINDTTIMRFAKSQFNAWIDFLIAQKENKD